MATHNPWIVVFKASRIPSEKISKLTVPAFFISSKATEIPITVPRSPSIVAIPARFRIQEIIVSGTKNSFRKNSSESSRMNFKSGFCLFPFESLSWSLERIFLLRIGRKVRTLIKSPRLTKLTVKMRIETHPPFANKTSTRTPENLPTIAESVVENSAFKRRIRPQIQDNLLREYR